MSMKVCVFIKDHFLFFEKYDQRWEAKINNGAWLGYDDATSNFLSYIDDGKLSDLLLLIDYEGMIKIREVFQYCSDKKISMNIVNWETLIKVIDKNKKTKYSFSFPKVYWLGDFLIPKVQCFYANLMISNNLVSCSEKLYLLEEKYFITDKQKKEDTVLALRMTVGEKDNKITDLMLENIELKKSLNDFNKNIETLHYQNFAKVLEKYLPIIYEKFWAKMSASDFAHLLGVEESQITNMPKYQSQELIATLLTEYDELPDLIKSNLVSFCSKLKPYGLTVRKSAQFIFE